MGLIKGCSSRNFIKSLCSTKLNLQYSLEYIDEWQKMQTLPYKPWGVTEKQQFHHICILIWLVHLSTVQGLLLLSVWRVRRVLWTSIYNKRHNQWVQNYRISLKGSCARNRIYQLGQSRNGYGLYRLTSVSWNMSFCKHQNIKSVTTPCGVTARCCVFPDCCASPCHTLYSSHTSRIWHFIGSF